MSTFLNCHGSSRSKPSLPSSFRRFFSGFQSVQQPRTGLMQSCWISRQRLQSISSGSTSPAAGFYSAQVIPAMIAEVTCSAVAFWLGARFRASSMVSCEPYQQAFLACPNSSTPSSSIPVTTYFSRILQCCSPGTSPEPMASRAEATASAQGWQAQWQVGRKTTSPPSRTVKQSAMEMASSWVTRKPICGPKVGHQVFTVTFMPGLVMQMAAWQPSRWKTAFCGTHFSCVPHPSSDGWWYPSEMKPSTDQVFQNSFAGRTSLDRWVSRSAMCTPFTPRLRISCAHSSLLLGSSKRGNPVSLARLTRACLTNQLTMPGLAPQQEMAVVGRWWWRTSRRSASRRPQLLRLERSMCSLEQCPSHSSLTVSMQKTPLAWQYWMISEEEVPTERLTQKPTLPVKTPSRISLKLSRVSATCRKATVWLTSGNSTGWGSMTVILSNRKCLLIRGSVPLPIEPCPITQMSLMDPYTRCASMRNLIHYKAEAAAPAYKLCFPFRELKTAPPPACPLASPPPKARLQIFSGTPSAVIDYSQSRNSPPLRRAPPPPALQDRAQPAPPPQIITQIQTNKNDALSRCWRKNNSFINSYKIRQHKQLILGYRPIRFLKKKYAGL